MAEKAGIQNSQFGKYQLITPLATGGMAEIFLARYTGPAGFEKLVVIKRILQHLENDKNFLNMFLDEARLAATLNHPNIVQIFELGMIGGRYFMAMEYLQGESVASLVHRCRKNRQRLPMEIACGVILQAADGLHHAHTKTDMAGKPLNIVHRDISPQNIFVLYDGLVKIVDFGIAKATRRTTRTYTGSLKGKFTYMSPEQIRQKELDRRSDIFSLGIVFWEMLAGRKLFRQESEIEVMNAILEEDAPFLSELYPKIPPELSQIVAKALQRDASCRYQSADELHQDLRDWLKKSNLEWDNTAIGKFMQHVFADRIKNKQELIEKSKVGEQEINTILFDALKEQASDTDQSVPRSTPSASMVTSQPHRKTVKLIVLVSLSVLLLGLFIGWQIGKMTEQTTGEAETVREQQVSLPTVIPIEEKKTPVPVVVEKENSQVAVTNSQAPKEANPIGSPQEDPATKQNDETKTIKQRPAVGYLRLMSDPWSEVWYGKKNLGQTPLLDVELPAGNVKLRLINNEEGLTKTIVVKIRPGKTTVRNIELK